MQQLDRDLASLPEVAPPADLVARVVRPAESSRLARAAQRWSASARAMLLAGWPGRMAVAAAVVGLAVWARAPRPDPVLELHQGEQRVVGDVRVLAGGVRVDVDGAATIRVEPNQRPSGLDQEERMQMTPIVSFGAGVLVTVAVTQGVASIQGQEDQPPVTVEAGERRTVPGPQALVGRDPAPPPVVEGATAEAQIEALEKTIAELTFERDVLRGQLSASGGMTTTSTPPTKNTPWTVSTAAPEAGLASLPP